MDWKEINPASLHRHPWELSRRRCLLALWRELGKAEPVTDLGAGDLFLAGALGAVEGVAVTAVDAHFPSGAATPRGVQLQPDSSSLAEASQGAVMMFDLLEHLDAEAEWLAEASRLLRPGGWLLLTVPAWPCLFSDHDRFLGHRRRYRRRPLRQLLDSAGFEVQELFYFYTLPWWARLGQRPLWNCGWGEAAGAVSRWPKPAAHWLTRMAAGVLDLDFRICRRLAAAGFHLPGLSLGAVCRKP